MASLYIHLLGNFHLVYDDEPITGVNTARLQSLLAYLVLHRQSAQSRQQLAFLFWPNTREAQALTNLRNLLHKLRHALPDPDQFLQIDASTVQWRPDALSTFDVADFAAAAAQTAIRSDLERAAHLYSGDLLPSCYDDWIRPEREHLHQIAISVFEQLIQMLEEEQEYRVAITYGQRLLQLDPLCEATYHKLIRLHALNGNRAVALKQYEECERVLRTELDVKPAPETVALMQWIKQTPLEAKVAPTVYTNLPVPVSSFIGRQREAAEVKTLLVATVARRRPAVRLITLTGTGGSGKTRLAIHIATDLVDTYRDGVYWVDLAPSLDDEVLVTQVVAKALNVREVPNQTLYETLAQFLQSRRLLLVLDNCERLVNACAQLANVLLNLCPELQILATSREQLGITGERVYQVPPLSLLDPHTFPLAEVLLQSEAIHLFSERAQALDASFGLTEKNVTTVLQICRQLDGIPLAIELAAARVQVLSIEQIAARLNDRFNLLTVGSRIAPLRHQTLRATVDWSYDLLTDAERILLQRVSVFAGRFTLAAVERICGPLQTSIFDLLSQLVAKSLVIVARDEDEVHYRLLETIREYAYEKLLTTDQETQLKKSHLNFFIQLAEAADSHLQGPEQERWLIRLEHAHDNVRVALSWSMEQRKDAEALRLSGVMGKFWLVRGYWSEGRQWLERALALSYEGDLRMSTDSAALSWYARAFWQAGTLAWNLCDFAIARERLEKGLTLYRELNNWSGVADVLGSLGGVAFEQGEYATARAFYEKYVKVARKMGDKEKIGASLFPLGLVVFHQGDYATARTLLEESLKLLREERNKFGMSFPLNTLGNLANMEGEYATAWMIYEETLALRRELGDKRGVAATLNDMANVKTKQGEYAAAWALYEESLILFRGLGNQRGIVRALSGLARIRHAQGHLQLATKLLGAVEALLLAMNARFDEPEYSDHKHAVVVLRTQLDQTNFNTAWEEGHNLTLEQVIQLLFQKE